jgi:LysM repeat protein
MRDDQEFLDDESLTDNRGYTSKHRSFRSSNRKSFQILLGIFIILIFIVSFIYFISKSSSKGGAILETRIVAIEQKISGFEKQLEEIQGKISSQTQDPGLIQRLESLEQRLLTLEKQKQAPIETKLKPQSLAKKVSTTEKKYHVVQKGETLYKIAKKYNISVDELRKLNGLPEGKPIKLGQKILIPSEQ